LQHILANDENSKEIIPFYKKIKSILLEIFFSPKDEEIL